MSELTSDPGLYVMLNGGGRSVSPRLRRFFVEFPDGSPPVIQGVRGPQMGEFLRAEVEPNELVPRTVALCTLLQPFTTSYKVGKCKTVLLRTLRCLGEHPPFEFLVWCAKCGIQLRVDAAHLDQMRYRMCEFCKASISTLACPAFHAFGSCTECSEVDLTEVPFAPTHGALKPDPAMQPVSA